MAGAGVDLPDNLDELNSEEKKNASKASSSNGDKDDISSIEALNWSDFEDDDLNEEDSKLLESINSQFSGISEKTQVGLHQRKHPFSPEKAATVVENETPIIQNETQENSKTANLMITSTHSVASDVTYLDSASNAPVLDDGPIWAKGSKLYKFEENRRFNQKLTFCVLFSVVLAVGLGVGNLAAYNECEAEHKGSTTSGNFDEKLNQDTPTYDGKLDKISHSRPGVTDQTITSTQIPSSTSKQSDTVKVEEIPDSDGEPAKVNKPMIDPKYALHAEELARVLKMLDELSRKIDRFENTTRQLGGIVMLRDDVIRPDSPTKKSKFLGLLNEIMKEKGKKKRLASKEETQQGVNWRVKKEQILDDIAEAVLGAMDVSEESFRETEPVANANAKLEETNQVNKNLETENNEIPPKISLKATVAAAKVEPDVEKRHASKMENDSTTPKPVQRASDKRVRNIESSNMTGDDNKNGAKKKPKYEKERTNQENQDSKRTEKKTKHQKDTNKQADRDSKRSEKKQKYEKDNKKHANQEYKRSEKKQKNVPKMKVEPKDWQAARAKFRQEGRAKSQINWNKKVNNWQAERYNERERLRLRDRRFS